ncbi:hypothetical protein A3D04_03305 [Candidatus Curtissbacteria bacterium RIFCSPHIGHO2_02_FULL_40_16b]|uniref:Uncharacterized protein n=1 Tax=Candidatus Curtissbacteria bacterium RIFCSPHIGHO2_02_FULL_40_16b TaxID=1797714 RepID=A0A1F5G7X7_9BACT|nr:MAG: hypothetical protein A3D04_03305 [Candidatus Curtissbacteria bacterium RIFCSPHIGHO2_02_FULL_40_16b]
MADIYSRFRFILFALGIWKFLRRASSFAEKHLRNRKISRNIYPILSEAESDSAKRESKYFLLHILSILFRFKNNQLLQERSSLSLVLGRQAKNT